ncbi:SpaA isopeptide-forming pilin-related protein [Streptococcus dysgalactiae]|uniref:SpaA isopeptide-forming pilin-related protein n=1 Tax=Streptococcus dysgalactiae TaxID=1334 RepID=UPI001559B27A|nr:SpaA isopeptide-forming pilin-related protein [Streptococcus dysgalactiae]
MTNKTLHKVLVKLAAVLAILFLVLPTGLTAVTVLAEQINTENLIPVETAAGEILKESDLDFEQAISTSGEALKDSSASWIQLTYNKVNQNLAKQNLFLRLPQGMTIEGIGQDQKLDVKTISVPKDLDLDEAASTINNTNIITGFEKIGEQDYKLSFAATSETLNLVFKVTDTILNETRDLQLGDKQDSKQASWTKPLSLGAPQGQDRASTSETNTAPSIQPRAVTDLITSGETDVSNAISISNESLLLIEQNDSKNNQYNVDKGESLSFKADLSLLNEKLIKPGNYFDLIISDSIHYNMLNPTDINFPVLKSTEGKVVAVPELFQDPADDGLIRATNKTVRYRFTKEVTGLQSLEMKLNLGHSVNPNVVQKNGIHKFWYQIGDKKVNQTFDIKYGDVTVSNTSPELNIKQRFIYTDSKQTLKASSLIYVNPLLKSQKEGNQHLYITPLLTSTGDNLLQLNDHTDIKIYKTLSKEGITDAVNLDKQYWQEVNNYKIIKQDGKIEVVFSYQSDEATAYVVAVSSVVLPEADKTVVIAQTANLINSGDSSVKNSIGIAFNGSSGSASRTQLKAGSLYLNKINLQKVALPGATFQLSGYTKRGEFLLRNLITSTKQVSFNNLPPGKYQLKEISAPSGYQQITKPWDVTVDDIGKVIISGNEQDSTKAQEAAEVVILWENISHNYTYGTLDFYKEKIRELEEKVNNPNVSYSVVAYNGTDAEVLIKSQKASEFKTSIDNLNFLSKRTERGGMLKAYETAFSILSSSTLRQKYLVHLTEYPIYDTEKSLVPSIKPIMDKLISIQVNPYLLIARYPAANNSRYLNPYGDSPSFGGLFNKDNIKVAWQNSTVSTLFQPVSNDPSYISQIQSIGSAIKQQIPESILTITNKTSGKFSINKIDEAKKGLAGATFTLSKRTAVAAGHQVQGDFIPVSKETTVGRTTLTFDNLKPGVYDLKETKAPNAYVLDPKTYVVVVQNSGKTTIVDEANFKEADYPMADNTSQFDYPTKEIANEPNKIVFTKIGDGGKSLSGAEFELRKGNEKVQTTTSGADGKVTFSKLLPGTYEVWETKVAEDIYNLPQEAVATFEVKADGTFSEPKGRLFRKNAQQNNRYEIRNELVNKKIGDQKIKVIKKDELTDLPLPKAKFQLEASDGTLYYGTTDDNGEISFDKLPFGQYILTEIEAPTGYILDPTPQKINITEVDAPETEVVAGGNAAQPMAEPITRAALAASAAEPVTGKDVSQQIVITKLDVASSNEDTPHNVRPNHGENIVMRTEFSIKPNSDIKAGDYFTLTLPDTIDPFGISSPENVGFRILGPLGTLALGTYDSSTHTITYKFTDYITRYTVSSFSIISPFFIDRDRVKTNQNIDLFLKVGQVSSTPYHFTVDYNPYYGTADTNNPVNIGSMITRLNQDTGDFVNYVYVNPASRFLKNASLTFLGHGSSIIDNNTKVQLFEVVDSKLQMPPSWGIQDETLREVDPANYQLIKENGRFTINFYNDLLYGRSYIVKVSGKSDKNDPDPIHTSAILTQRYFNDYPYYTPSGRYIPYGPYTESFTFTAEVVKKSGESNADGSVIVRLSNRKNYIDFVKSDAQGNPLEATFELRKKTATNDTVTVGTPVTSDKATGKFYFEGLPPGDYEVWETKAPDGYVKPVKAVATFRINDEGEVVEKSLEDGRIINYPRPELPATGGMGWIVYMVMGSAICFIAIFWNRPFRFKK